jgi:tripartite ATP-independent transporter DctM subunit
MFGSMIALLMTGRQVLFIIGSIAAVSTIALWGVGGADMVYFSTYQFMDWYLLVAFPMYIFMGFTLSRSGVGEKLYNAIYLWMGGLKGGLGIGTVGLCALIACMSGANVAATVTAATIALPEMLKRKYDKVMTTGLIQASGALGFLIPPSLVMIIYGLIARVSIGHLWVAGIMPGILLASLYMTYIGVRCRLQPNLGPPIPPEERVGWGPKFRALGAGIGPVFLIFGVLGLLFLGVTSLVESSAIGACGALALAAINRRLSWAMMKGIVDEVARITSLILFIFLAAMLFGAVYNGLGAAHAVENIFNMIGLGKWGTMILMMLSWYAMGTVMDDTALLVIVAPLYIPIVLKMGFSLVWFGVLYIINMQSAFITPPFGYNLFIMKGILPSVAPNSGITLTDLYRSAIPFVIVQVCCMALVMAFPQLALWLVGVVFHA